MAADAQAGRGTRTVLLLDTSASMRRDDLWAQARAKTKELLRKAALEDQVAVFAFDRAARPIVTFAEWAALAAGDRAALVGARVDAAPLSWAGTHLGNAMIAASEALEEATKQESETVTRRIVVISDLQEGSRLEGLQGYEWPRGVETSLEPVKSKRPTNAGLQWVLDRDDSDKPAAEAGPRARIYNSAESKQEQFQIGWVGADRNAFGGAVISAYVPPGQSRIVQAPKLPAGFTPERLRLTGDEHDFDNALALVAPKAERVPVLFLGADDEKDASQLLFYLKNAFQQTRRQVVEISARSSAATLLPTDWESAALVIVGDTLPDEITRTLRRVLTEGKMVLLVMKTPAAAHTLAQLLNLGAVPAEEAAVANYAMFGQIEFEHPLFLPFADPRFSDFTKIHFWKYRRLDTDKLPGARVLARFDSGDAALVQLAAGKGSVFVLTSGWQPADSQLALSSKFVPLLYSMLEQSGGIKAQLAQYLVGDEVPLPHPNATQPLKVRKPDGREVEARVGANFTETDLPGVYTVTSAQPPVQFAVNLAPEESRTAPLVIEELSRLGVPLKQQPLMAARDLEKKRQLLHAAELENRQKMWRWLLLAALTVLVMETWLAGWITRRGTSSPAPAAQ
jgi:hypothetical protein